MRFLLTGGRQRVSVRKHKEWHRYDDARLVQLDTKTGKVELKLRHQTPDGECPSDMPSHVFKASFRQPQSNLLWVVTLTEVLCIDCSDFQIKERFSHPWFNDLHHVAPVNGMLHVVSTGLDSLISLDGDREVVSIRHAMGDDPWSRFDRNIDYRLVPSTKPHASHPNYVFSTVDGLWLTRFEQQDAICLEVPGHRIPIDFGNPHDGITINERVWFTTVNGFIVCADPRTGEIVQSLDLNAIDKRNVPLGWCRGIWVENDIAYVGFSRLRHTKIRENVSWVTHGFRKTSGYTVPPTRVAAYNLSDGRLTDEWNLEDVGLNALFSIIPN